MFTSIKKFQLVLTSLCLLFLFACSDAQSPDVKSSGTQQTQSPKISTNTSSKVSTNLSNNISTTERALLNDVDKSDLVIYKNPNCGCCQKWIDHLSSTGLQSKVINQDNMSALKASKKIQPRYQSCHTGISKEGFVFEGHVPAKYIQQFLAQTHKDEVIGLSVPAMPVGSPGMEVGDQFMPYQILLLKADGTNEVYAKITAYEQQF